MNNLDYAIEGSTKFEFYLLALVFTILGLSIQTGDLDSAHYQYVFEIAAWISMLISGLAGLSRMEWKPILYNHAAEQEKDNELARALQNPTHTVISNETRAPFTPAEVSSGLNVVKKRIEDRQAHMTRAEKLCKVKYNIHRCGFAAGLTLLIISRILKGIGAQP